MTHTHVSIKDVAEQSGISESLIRSVIRQLGGRESLSDVANYGASGGYSGFTYYHDTVGFFKRNRAEIVEMVKRMADDLGEEPLSMVAGFNCLKPADDETKASIAVCLFGRRMSDADTQVANALAWFALEEVARAFERVEEDRRQ